MSLLQWWLGVPERVSPKVPLILKAILIPWVLIGIMISIIPDLQVMPGGIRLFLGLPAALGILWMAFGLLLAIGDKLIALGKRVGKAH